MALFAKQNMTVFQRNETLQFRIIFYVFSSVNAKFLVKLLKSNWI